MIRSTLALLATLALFAMFLVPVGAYPQAVNWSTAPTSTTTTSSSRSTTVAATSTTASPTGGTRTWTTRTTLTATTTSSSSASSTLTLTPITSTATATSISNIILSNNVESDADLSAIMSIALPTALPISGDGDGDGDDDDDDDDVDNDNDDALNKSDLPPPDVQEMIINTLLALGQNPENVSSSDALTAAAAAAALGSSSNSTSAVAARALLLPPPSPTAFVRYLGDGTAFVENLGYNYTQVGQQCRGLQGTVPIENVLINTRYPDGRPAYALQFFGEWACQGRVLATTSGYTGNGQPLRGSDGRIVVPRSSRFVPILA